MVVAVTGRVDFDNAGIIGTAGAATFGVAFIGAGVEVVGGLLDVRVLGVCAEDGVVGVDDFLGVCTVTGVSIAFEVSFEIDVSVTEDGVGISPCCSWFGSSTSSFVWIATRRFLLRGREDLLGHAVSEGEYQGTCRRQLNCNVTLED